jgi:dTMP kinase
VFVVFEGLDGSGTSTQLERIGRWLGCVTTFEPTNGPIGSLIREQLKEGSFSNETMALLFAADRKEHNKQIKRWLSENRTVVCDRYIYSSLAYQKALGVNADLLHKINEDFIKPDVLIYFKIDVDLCINRIKDRDKDTFENVGLQTYVKDEYEKVLVNYPHNIVDASRPEQEVTIQLQKYITDGLMRTVTNFIY